MIHFGLTTSHYGKGVDIFTCFYKLKGYFAMFIDQYKVSFISRAIAKQKRYGGVEINLVISSVQCKLNVPLQSMVFHACKYMLVILHLAQNVRLF